MEVNKYIKQSNKGAGQNNAADLNDKAYKALIENKGSRCQCNKM